MIDKLKVPPARLSVDWGTAKEKTSFPSLARFSLAPNQKPEKPIRWRD